MCDQPDPGAGPSAGTRIVRSAVEGLVIGAGAGMVYAIVIATWGGVSSWSVSGFLGLALLSGLVAVPVGLVLGTGFGIIFGALLRKVRRPALMEVSVVAVFGGLVLALVATGADDVSSGILAWGGGPLLAGVPAAALHGYRHQRRTNG